MRTLFEILILGCCGLGLIFLLFAAFDFLDGVLDGALGPILGILGAVMALGYAIWVFLPL